MRPVILKRIGFERFEIIKGNLEYYACLIAKEKERSLETINAFVVDKKVENIALQQMQLLSPSSVIITPPEKTDNPLELRISNLEKRLETQLKILRDEHKKYLQAMQEDYTEKIANLTLPVNPISPPPPPSKSILELLNTCDAHQLKKAGIPPTSVNDFLKKRSEKPFDSLEDILNRPVAGVKERRLIKLMDYLLTSN
jgi:ParB family chromosome partitioning protein